MNFLSAFIIGLTQAIAVIPGLSRSGTTISTGLMLGVKRNEVAKFSFLMVLIPIIGEAALDIMKGDFINSSIGLIPMLTGFISAFVCGWLACKFMVTLVRKGNLLWFAIYCIATAILAFIL
jgi:undecaprenyl-diphosphatase